MTAARRLPSKATLAKMRKAQTERRSREAAIEALPPIPRDKVIDALRLTSRFFFKIASASDEPSERKYWRVKAREIEHWADIVEAAP